MEPTPRQLKELRRLALRLGETFAIPDTKGEASTQIERLRARLCCGDSADRRNTQGEDLRAIRGRFLECTPASSVREDEVTGYGSSARWA